MRMNIKKLLIILVLAVSVTACFDDNDDVFASGNTVKNFVYRGMNAFYLYKADVPVLDNDRFATVADLEEYHAQFPSPESFFSSLIFEPENVDKFSVIFEDYVVLQNVLSGQNLSNGMEFGLVAEDGSASDIFGYVRYVQPNSDADLQGVTRGMVFNGINGIRLTRNNFQTLLSQDSYSIDLATLSGRTTTSTGNSIALNKQVLQENPILLSKVIDQGSQKIGYLMYTSFLSQFDEDLNNVFANFQAQGVTHLVLDLRYNGGGSVNSAITLASMISGNPTSDVFSTEEWNPDVQQFFLDNNPERLTNFFRRTTINNNALNTLNLDKVHIITTGSSASASELVINGLDPYIDVVQVGDHTAGKFQASITLYDSPDFSFNNVNPSHRYAMQPLVLKSVNSAGVTDYFDGLAPDIRILEDFENLGELGDENEPLLKACLDDIALNGRLQNRTSQPEFQLISDSKDFKLLGNDMWK
ncbi:peptidase S41 [Nonlabens tegetincola]|nr:peptidase S41 [Nonlabens tegetincola]